ncbi:MAG: hypothetical protein IJZ98_05470 [Bacteroidales bacterium]|nr:hypothetical protein [Bacteroidales bacterium]
MPAKTSVFYPEMLQSSAVISEADALKLEGSSDFGQSSAPANKTFWVVFSDRADNPTYTEPGGSDVYTTLAFNEQLRIAQIRNGYALVYSEPQESIAYPMISPAAVNKGWISMKKLLLWHSCPTNEAGIYNKALLCVNMDEKKGSDLGRLYKNPSDKNLYETLMTDMKFYFVMKREGDLSLLASEHSLDGHSDQMLKGWVANQSFVAWNQRSCLEWTWNHKDVEYFSDESICGYVYKEKDRENCVLTKPFKRRTSKSYDKYLYRMNPDELRYPILDDGTADLYSCSTFSPPGGPSEVERTDANSTVSSKGFSEKVLRAKTNINIGIVIDGTNSMASYYPAVKEAIKKGCNYFGKKYKVKVGVVIYRDYTEGEFCTERLPLTPPENPKFAEFLDNGGSYGVRNSAADRTNAEALYAGIDEALDRLGFKPDQTNILLVVGDCGNDKDDTRYSSEDLIAKIVEKDVDVMGFQVRRTDSEAFESFNDQLLDLMSLSLQRRYSKLKNNLNVEIKGYRDGYKLVNDDKSILYIGSHSFPDVGKEMPVTKLTSLMEEAIISSSEKVNYQIDLLASFSAGGFAVSKDVVGTDVDLNEEWLKHELGDHYEQIKKSNSLLAFRGYASKAHKSGKGFFKPVVFISSDELNSLIDRLAPVNVAAAIEDDREPYVNAMKHLAQSMIPEDLSDDQLNQMTIDEIMRMVNGLNESASALKSYTIAEVASHRIVTSKDYIALVSKFVSKYNKLVDLKSMPYKYTFTSNGLKYYWLPVEDLP